jgi:hypothetical protein
MSDSGATGFSFLTSTGGAGGDETSSFSFLNRAEEEASPDYTSEPQSVGSSFSFLSASASVDNAEESSSQPPSTSGFSFLGGAADQNAGDDRDLLGAVITAGTSQEIKLARVAKAKQVLTTYPKFRVCTLSFAFLTLKGS